LNVGKCYADEVVRLSNAGAGVNDLKRVAGASAGKRIAGVKRASRSARSTTHRADKGRVGSAGKCRSRVHTGSKR